MAWQLARRWVISTGVSLENRSIQSSEDLRDFAESLRDGVILCRIANLLVPYSVNYSARKIQNIDRHEFLCKRNIALFLNTCRDVLHLNSKDLFTTDDLYDLTNFGAVVKTLSVVSQHSDAADIRGCRPFSISDISIRSVEEDDRSYEQLSKETNKGEPLTKTFSKDIYDEDNYCKSAYHSLIYRTSSPHTRPLRSSAPSGKRAHIVNEILETEEGYMKHIRTIVQSYIPALKPYMTQDDKLTVFLNVDDIYTLHLNFYRELSAQTSKDTQQQADISAFLRYKERFLIYAHYCTHLHESQTRVDQLSKKATFHRTVENLNTKLQRRVSLKDQLSVCFQRVLRYKLLLAELLKHTPKEHEEHHTVENALAAMEDVAKYINEFKRDQDVVSEIDCIQKTLKFRSTMVEDLASLRVDFGRHVHDGELLVQFEGTNKREPRVTFLFEQELLLCKENGDFNEVHDIMSLRKLTVKNAQPSWKGKFSQTSGRYSHCFTLRTDDQDNCAEQTPSCRIFTKTEQLKKSWMEAIRKCIQVVTLEEHEGKLNSHAFRLTTFDCDEYYSCDTCQMLLLGQVSQGYVCQNGDCHLRAHAGCLENSLPCQSSSGPKLMSVYSCIQTERRKKTVEEVTALTVNQSTRSNTMQNEEYQGLPLLRHLSMEDFHWFSGPMTRDQSEDLLDGFPTGSFLIRENKDGVLVLSVQYNDKTFHIKIKEQNEQFYLSESQRFTSIEDTIAYYQANSLVSNFPQLPTVLTELTRSTYI